MPRHGLPSEIESLLRRHAEAPTSRQNGTGDLTFGKALLAVVAIIVAIALRASKNDLRSRNQPTWTPPTSPRINFDYLHPEKPFLFDPAILPPSRPSYTAPKTKVLDLPQIKTGERLEKEGKYREAAVEYRAAAEMLAAAAEHFVDKDLGYCRLARCEDSLADCLWQCNERDEALEHHHIALMIYEHLVSKSIKPGTDEHIIVHAHRRIGLDFVRRAEAERAIDHFTVAVEVANRHRTAVPDCRDAASMLGNAHLDRGNANAELEQWTAAIDDFRAVIDVQPDASQAHLNLARALLGSGRQREYREACRAAVARFRTVVDPNTLNNMAWACALSPDPGVDWNDVAAMALRAVEAEPSNPYYVSTLGSVLYRQGKHAAAEEKLNRAIELGNRVGTHYDHFFLAMAYSRLGRTEDARRSFDRAMQLSKENRSWTVRVDYALLRTEAQALLK